MKNISAQEVSFRDGGKTLNALEAKAKTASGEDLAAIKAKQAQYKKDTWVTIHGIVYDVTNFLKDHPGGPESILACAGKDATIEFEDIFHSSSARDSLSEMVVGKLDTYDGPLDAIHSAGNSSSGSSQTIGLLVPVIVVALAVAYFVLTK